MAYLSAYIPEANSTQRSVKTSWAGLNRLQTQDSGELSDAVNISLREYPFITSAPSDEVEWRNYTGGIVSVHSTGDDSYVVISKSGEYLYFHYVSDGKTVSVPEGFKDEGGIPSVAVFNVYDDTDDNIVTAGFTRRILIYPYCLSFDPEGDAVLKSFNVSDNAVPKLKQVVVMNGRVFGVLDGKFYASKWNNYAGWNLPAPDTLTEDIPSMAWVSTTQSDIDASGDFTGITVYDGHVIGFKRNFMHMLYNNKNPFRIVDVAKVGAISQQAICQVGQILFFVADDGVYAFTGGYPKRISDKLNISDYEGAVLGGDDRTLYCYVPSKGKTFTYDTVNSMWSCVDVKEMRVCATVGGELFWLDGSTDLRKFGSEYKNFSFDTDASFGGALIEKKIKRVRLQVTYQGVRGAEAYVSVSVIKQGGDIVSQKRIDVDPVFWEKFEKPITMSMLTRMTCDFGHVIRVEGKGNWIIGYLQIDYESGGEKYV